MIPQCRCRCHLTSAARRYLMAAAVAMLPAAAAHGDSGIEVMILGVYHMANPGQDLYNAEAANVTTAARQGELRRVADALAAFHPDKIAVEATSDRADLTLAAFEGFAIADLQEDRNENTQIGYRLAHRLGHDAVYGIDEHSDAIDYFPFGQIQAYVKNHGLEERLASINAPAEQHVSNMTDAQQEKTIAGMLRWLNRPSLIQRLHQSWYYSLLKFADATEQPGALVNGRYYLRNARIFAKLSHVAKPGDRVLVVFGAGHAYWLRHLVEETPGYGLVEPNDYLTAVASGSR